MLVLICNRLAKLVGVFVKVLGYMFHFFKPRKRFLIPSFDAPRKVNNNKLKVTKIIWQTNFTNKVALPMYINYLYNRLLSRDWSYRFISTDERLQYINEHATQREIEAYKRLNNGAAQADFWRLFVLYKEGGVYMDIDAHLVWPLSWIVEENDNEIILSRPGKDYTNYFIASSPGNKIFKDILNKVVLNIESNNKENSNVYGLTGPGVMNEVISNMNFKSRVYKKTCIQGSFTNEYFQYIDKPNGKWIHADVDKLLKK